jgi:hypothetical protein
MRGTVEAKENTGAWGDAGDLATRLERPWLVPGRAHGDQVVTMRDVFVLLAEPHHGGSGRATVFTRTRKEAQHVWVEVRA